MVGYAAQTQIAYSFGAIFGAIIGILFYRFVVVPNQRDQPEVNRYRHYLRVRNNRGFRGFLPWEIELALYGDNIAFPPIASRSCVIVEEDDDVA